MPSTILFASSTYRSWGSSCMRSIISSTVFRYRYSTVVIFMNSTNQGTCNNTVRPISKQTLSYGWVPRQNLLFSGSFASSFNSVECPSSGDRDLFHIAEWEANESQRTFRMVTHITKSSSRSLLARYSTEKRVETLLRLVNTSDNCGSGSLSVPLASKHLVSRV